MIDNILVPVIKSKTGRIMSKDNYRPLALASVVSKVAESIIFNRISCYLDTYPNQFGLKRNHGTDQCILNTLYKETSQAMTKQSE